MAHHLNEDLGVAQDKIHLIPNGIDLDRFTKTDAQKRLEARRKWGVGDGPLVGIIARLSDVKGIDVLIKAMVLILKEIPSAKLMVA